MNLSHQCRPLRSSTNPLLFQSSSRRHRGTVADDAGYLRSEWTFPIDGILADSLGSVVCIICRPDAPGGRCLSLASAGLSLDGMRVQGPADSPWGRFVVMHARNTVVHSRSVSSVQVRSASALGSAILCQLPWQTPQIGQSREVIVCKNRALACQFIRRSRADIFRHLNIAFREPITTDTFHLEGDAYYATLGAAHQ